MLAMKRTQLDRIGWLVLICLVLVLPGGADQSRQDAFKVQGALKRIEQQLPTAGGGRAVDVTQQELNAYIAYRLERQEKPVIDRFEIELLANNHVQGTLSFDAQQLALDAILGENLIFKVKGILITQAGEGRLDLISAHLNGRRVKPQVFNFVLDTAVRYCGGDSASLDSWVQLPTGIERIAIQTGKMVLYY
jgi:hypothetical protein